MLFPKLSTPRKPLILPSQPHPYSSSSNSNRESKSKSSNLNSRRTKFLSSPNHHSSHRQWTQSFVKFVKSSTAIQRATSSARNKSKSSRNREKSPLKPDMRLALD